VTQKSSAYSCRAVDQSIYPGESSRSLMKPAMLPRLRFSIFDALAVVLLVGLYVTLRNVVIHDGFSMQFVVTGAEALVSAALCSMRRTSVIVCAIVGGLTALFTFSALAAEVISTLLILYPGYFSWRADFPTVLVFATVHVACGVVLGASVALLIAGIRRSLHRKRRQPS
jgi:hypothetical protein